MMIVVEDMDKTAPRIRLSVVFHPRATPTPKPTRSMPQTSVMAVIMAVCPTLASL